jgi:tetratricopeptide (TPR) repeat protein
MHDLCIALGDGDGALESLIANAEEYGPERTLEQLAAMEKSFPDDPRICLERAIRVLAPRGRAREVALDLERVLERDPASALDQGLPYARGLLVDHGDEPELRRVLTRLCMREGESEEALDHLSQLACAGNAHRAAVLRLFAELAEQFPSYREARIRWAEVLAEAARAAGPAAGLWEACEERCREVLELAPEPEEELRTTKLLAASLEARERFDEAAELLLDAHRKFPEEAEILTRIRKNHLRHLRHRATNAKSGRERAAAHLLAGNVGGALGVLEDAEDDDEEAIAVRAWAHYAAGDHDRVIAECSGIVTDLPPDGLLPEPLPDVLYFLGRSCLRAGDEARGIRLLERLARDHPGHHACRAFLEEHYRRSEAGEERELELTAGLEEVNHGQA